VPPPSGPPAQAALEAVLEYHVRHFESDSLGPPGKDTSKAPAVLSSMPAPYPSHEIPLTVSQVVPSTVAGGLVYCVAESDSGGPILYVCHVAGGVEPQVVYESDQLGAAIRAFVLPFHPAVNSPRKGSTVLHDLIAISDGTLLDVEIHTPPDLLPRVHATWSSTTRLNFFSSTSTPFGYAAALFWDDEGTSSSKAEGYFGRVTGSASETRVEVRRLVVEEQSLAPGEEELSTRIGAVSLALREATICVDAYLATAHTVVGMTALPGRFVVTMAGCAPLQWCKGDDDVGSIRLQNRSRGTPVLSASVVQDEKAYLATFSKNLEVQSFDAKGEHPEHLLDDSTDETTGGAFHPIHSHLLFFTKNVELCVLDLRQRSIRVVGDIQKGERESGDEGETTLNLLSFTADGGYLLRHAVGESLVAVYRWSDLVAHLERINAESEVINNAVYLPGRVAAINVQDVYKEVVATLRRQRGVTDSTP